jgi:hypothetical protein
MADGVTFSRMTAEDFLAIDRQPSQRVCLHGEPPTLVAALQLEEQDEAWSARDATGRLLACMGVLETFAGRCGVVWAVLGYAIGWHHLAISRFARARIELSPLARLEALARARDVEPFVDAFPNAGGAELLAYAMDSPTAECRWPPLLGLAPAHVVRRFGVTGETYVLFERVLPIAVAHEVTAHG